MNTTNCEERVDQACAPDCPVSLLPDRWGVPAMVSPLPWEIGYWGEDRGQSTGFHDPAVFDVGGRLVCRAANISDADFIVYAAKLVLALRNILADHFQRNDPWVVLHTDELAELLQGVKR